jgi:signal transduction histidine kinase
MNVRRKNIFATVFLIVLLLSLPAAAAIQTVWLNSASRGEADRMRRGLSNAARQIRADLSFEFASIATLLSPQLDGGLPSSPAYMDHLLQVFPEFYAAWRDQSRFPDLIDHIVYVGPLSDWTPFVYDNASSRFGQAAQPYAPWLDETIQTARDMLGGTGTNSLTIPVPLSRIVERVQAGAGNMAVRIIDPGYLIVRLDRSYLASVVLPQLVDTYFGAEQDEYLVAVVDHSRSELLWANFDTDYPSATADDALPPDEQVSLSPWSVVGLGVASLFGRDSPADVTAGIAQRFREPLVQQWLEFRTRGPGDDPREEPISRQFTADRGLSTLVWHTAGGVEAAARAGRNRNLLFSYLALSVLAGAAIAYYVLFRRANRLREREHEFVATVTHELRTPVAAIHAVADNLAEGIITRPDQVKEYGQAMLDEGRRLRTMIDQVLLYAGLQGGLGVRRLTEIKIDDLVTRACSRIPELSRDHLITRIEPHLPTFRGDPTAVESIIRNLISNAAKHNDSETQISLTVRSDHAARGIGAGHRFNLVIEVKDDGRGIPRRELSQVGDPFFRGAQSQADQISGSGLGLSLVRRIADTYGGSLTVNSTLGEGTAVTVRLPFERGDKNES